MALIICPECGGKVSDRAAACPHCGYPMSAPDTPTSDMVEKADQQESTNMTTWDVTESEVAVCCKKCGRVLRFDKRYFSDISPDGVTPNALLKCPVCGTQSAAGLKLPYKSDVKYSCAQTKKNSQAKCPMCGSTDITIVKKGFGLGKAALGGLLLGPVGLLGGAVGSNKIKRVCLNCKHQF